MIPLVEIYIMWTRLNFSNITENELQQELCIQRELDMVQEHFKKIDIEEKVNIT